MKNPLSLLGFDPQADDWILRLSLLIPIVLVAETPARALMGIIIASIGLVVPGMARNKWFWLLVAAAMTVSYLVDWRTLDNHMALAAYWMAAIALSFWADDQVRHLRLSAQAVIGLTFLFAMGWKARSPDFLSGGFFEYTLLTDPRFQPIVVALTTTSAADLAANRMSIAFGAPGPVTLISSSSIESLAITLTVGTLIIESAVAIGWLAPMGRLRVFRHTALAAFAVVTYLIVPVVGFGFLLLIMAGAAVETTRARRRYAMGAAALLVFGLAWNLLVL